MATVALKLSFPEAHAMYDRLCQSLEVASVAWRSVPGVGEGRMGLTPDHVKFGAAYQAAKLAYDAAHAELSRFNGWYQKAFAKELRAERRDRWAAKAAKLNGGAQ